MKRIWILLLVIGLAAGGWFGYQQWARTKAAAANTYQTITLAEGELTAIVGATGSVRTNQSAILTWQTNGTIEQVNVKVGQEIKAKDILAALDPTSVSPNILAAQADLVNARKAKEDLFNTGLQLAQANKNVSDARQALIDYLNDELRIAQAQSKLANAQQAVKNANNRLVSLSTPADQLTIDQAKNTVTLAKIAMDKAWDRYKSIQNLPANNTIRTNLYQAYLQAKQNYEDAVKRVNNLQGTADSISLGVAEANLVEAQAAEKQALKDYEEAKAGPNPDQVALLQAKIEDAQEKYQDIKDGPDADEIAAADARIDAAQATINLTRLTAPFNGVVSDVEAKTGDLVDAGVVAFRLDDLTHLFIDVQVSEVDINRVQVGQAAILTFDAISGKEYRGKVYSIATIGSSSAGAVNFGVTVELTDADALVKPGMTAAASIITTQLNGVLVVPSRSVRVVENQRVVYLLKDGKAVAVPVTLGAASDTSVQILSGDLKVGDLVIVNPPTSSLLTSFQNGQMSGGQRMFGGNR